MRKVIILGALITKQNINSKIKMRRESKKV